MIKSSSFLLLFIIVSVLSLGCSELTDSSSPKEEHITKRRTQLPVTQIIQTTNLPYHQTWQVILAVLKELKIPIAMEKKNQGRITSEWIPIRDSLCGSYPPIEAPLSCKVRYSIALQSINKTASVLTIRYIERCAEKEDQPFECPDSNAERLMKEIIAKFRASAGLVD